MTALEIIEMLGGHTVVAKETGVPLTTISSWGRFNQIPEWRRPKLLELAAKQGKALSTADFPEKDARVSRTAAA